MDEHQPPVSPMAPCMRPRTASQIAMPKLKCPICGRFYGRLQIELHASRCSANAFKQPYKPRKLAAKGARRRSRSNSTRSIPRPQFFILVPRARLLFWRIASLTCACAPDARVPHAPPVAGAAKASQKGGCSPTRDSDATNALDVSQPRIGPGAGPSALGGQGAAEAHGRPAGSADARMSEVDCAADGAAAHVKRARLEPPASDGELTVLEDGTLITSFTLERHMPLWPVVHARRLFGQQPPLPGADRAQAQIVPSSLATPAPQSASAGASSLEGAPSLVARHAGANGATALTRATSPRRLASGEVQSPSSLEHTADDGPRKEVRVRPHTPPRRRKTTASDASMSRGMSTLCARRSLARHRLRTSARATRVPARRAHPRVGAGAG